MATGLFIFGIIVSLSVRIYFILNGSQIADVHTLREMGEMIERDINPYLALNYNVYPPLAIYLEFASIRVAQFLDIPFYIITKILPNLADFLIALLLYKSLIKKGVQQIYSYTWTLIFLLNPISILTSAAHGQIDSIPTFLVILATYLLIFQFDKYYLFISPLLLGLAIAIKPNPLVLVPLLLTFKHISLKNKLVFVSLAILPTLLLFIPFMLDNFQFVLGKMISYSGPTDFGLSAIYRGFHYPQTNIFEVEFSEQMIQITKAVFLIGLGFLVLIYHNYGKVIQACLAAYLLFLTSYLGISAQYLSWILPFAILERQLMIIPFSLAGLAALLGFYFSLNPTILLAQFSQIDPYQNQFILLYIFGNALLWITTLWWLIKIISTHFKNRT